MTTNEGTTIYSFYNVLWMFQNIKRDYKWMKNKSTSVVQRVVLIVGNLLWYNRNKTLQDVVLLENNIILLIIILQGCHSNCSRPKPSTSITDSFPITAHSIVFYSLSFFKPFQPIELNFETPLKEHIVSPDYNYRREFQDLRLVTCMRM